MDLSLVIPVYNEEKNIALLHQKLRTVLDSLNQTYEIIFVDDGSQDNTLKELLKLKKLRIIQFRKNFGQSAAINAGFKSAQGDLIISMDGDLQNDPADIPQLLHKLDEGYDVVCGWRKKREDSFQKKLFSRLASKIRRKLLKTPLHDFGCTLRLYKKECLENLELLGEMHRYIPAILSSQGFRIGEVEVNHYPRRYGKTKYGFNRLLKGTLDLLYIKFWSCYSTRPLHFFGLLGFLQYLLSALIFIEQITKAFLTKSLVVGPLLLLSALLVITGTIFLMFGFLGEIIIRTYYSQTEEKPYSIKRTIER